MIVLVAAAALVRNDLADGVLGALTGAIVTLVIGTAVLGRLERRRQQRQADEDTLDRLVGPLRPQDRM